MAGNADRRSRNEFSAGRSQREDRFPRQETKPGMSTWHYEKCKYYQSTDNTHAHVLQNLVVHGSLSVN